MPTLKVDDAEYEIDDMSPEQQKMVRRVSELNDQICLLYTSPSPRDGLLSRMPSSA